MNTKEYNGWTNYETWLVKLWQDNSEGDQDFWTEQAEWLSRGANPVQDMADNMKSHYEHASEELVGVNGFWTDLVGAAMSEVNWREIAEHWIEAVKETEAA